MKTLFCVLVLLLSSFVSASAQGNYQVLRASSAITVTTNVDISTPPSTDCVWITLDVSAVSGTTPSMTVSFSRFDPITAGYIPIPGATTAAITAVGVTDILLCPSVTATANRAISTPVPARFRIIYTISGTTPSFTTYTVAEWIFRN